MELAVTQQDWDAADPELLQTMFGQLVLIRVFEEYVLELAAPLDRAGTIACDWREGAVW